MTVGLIEKETERLPLDLLRPLESEAMEMHEANPEVNNVRNNCPELLQQTERAANLAISHVDSVSSAVFPKLSFQRIALNYSKYMQ